MTATAATTRDCSPARGVFSRSDWVLVNTVSVWFIFSRDFPPITQMLMEYSPVLTMMPASRLLIPIRVCSRAVTKPEQTPAPMAAGMDR